ncbi:MAG: hypothetical protein DHS20C15_06880 [Planctomycetota bacterium]|nr:MAG: hypothetical protein DHS20C15_06880 [Planctomycetota bacterium]
MFSLLPCLLACLCALPVDEDREETDTVYLLDGKTREGRVVYEDADTLVLLKGTRETEIPQAEIQDVDAIGRHLNALLDRIQAAGPLPQQSAANLLELARFADQARLPGEARLLRYAALLADPHDEAALDALHARTRGDSSQIKLGKRWVDTRELREPIGKWKDRLSVSTTHYALESNQALPQIVAAAFEMERFYRDFFALLAKPVQLREPDEIMHVRLHADEGSFPEPGDGRRGFFDRTDRSVAVDVSGPGWEARVVHELTRQLLFQTSQRSRRASGEVPSWIEEGLAVSFASGRSGPPGLGEHDPTALAPHWIRIHAAAPRPFALDRVLVFSFEDFVSTLDQDLKYAQAYTLMHTMLASRGGQLRDEFLAYLHSAYLGQASNKRLRELLGVSDDELAELWQRHLNELLTQI